MATPSRQRTPLQDWRAGGRFIDWRGHAIFVREGGVPDGEALLLIHGFPTASWDWEAIWPALAARYRVCTLDMLGFGFSAKPKRHAYSLLDQASLFESYLQALGISAYHVLAHDYGDSVAQELLARQREPGERATLRSVAFLNGGLFPETHRPALIQRLLLTPLGPLIARLTTRARLGANLKRIFGAHTPPDEAFIDGCWRLITTNDGRAIMHRLIGYIRERRVQRARWVGALIDSPVPLKLIDGAADPISGAHMAARYRELVPHADVTLLDGIGHYPQVEAPDAVLAAYFEFRNRIV
jgi:pimeloyl-ACP methyl ester carboxylesterase